MAESLRLKGEYAAFGLREFAQIYYVRFIRFVHFDRRQGLTYMWDV